MSVPDALAIAALNKRYSRPAVRDLTLTIRPGEFYALLGPNGAGKTTTLKMVAGLLVPDSGRISVFGHDTVDDPLGAKRVTAWVPDEPMIYDRLTPLEYLEFVAGLWEVPQERAKKTAGEVLDILQLAPHAHERCEGFSKGMRQKVALAGALIHEPKLIILDEPLTGLDAGSARLVKDVLLRRVEEGCTVILTTHILEVAERMAQRIGVIAQGRLVCEGTLAELRMANGGRAGSGGGQDSLEEIFLKVVADSAASEGAEPAGKTGRAA
ncbi:MAG: ABC transporter ATP-binding protein [Nitratireductor sp.]|nr:ABC transporter ATP-binding protein [Nitratireductor sp.]